MNSGLVGVGSVLTDASGPWLTVLVSVLGSGLVATIAVPLLTRFYSRSRHLRANQVWLEEMELLDRIERRDRPEGRALTIVYRTQLIHRVCLQLVRRRPIFDALWILTYVTTGLLAVSGVAGYLANTGVPGEFWVGFGLLLLLTGLGIVSQMSRVRAREHIEYLLLSGVEPVEDTHLDANFAKASSRLRSLDLRGWRRFWLRAYLELYPNSGPLLTSLVGSFTRRREHEPLSPAVAGTACRTGSHAATRPRPPR